ncbi:hypothetical protein [Myxococcus phage Mx1]|nr:hypothetical protein [Myxococcus phage Mx1]
MLLSARMLNGVATVNDFCYTSSVSFTEGDGPTIYFQLIDATKDTSAKGFSPAGRRYMPAAGATLECVVHHIDDARLVRRFASQPFPEDGSIWALQLQSTDRIRGTSDILLTLIESGRTTRGAIRSAITAHSQLAGC